MKSLSPKCFSSFLLNAFQVIRNPIIAPTAHKKHKPMIFLLFGMINTIDDYEVSLICPYTSLESLLMCGFQIGLKRFIALSLSLKEWISA